MFFVERSNINRTAVLKQPLGAVPFRQKGECGWVIAAASSLGRDKRHVLRGIVQGNKRADKNMIEESKKINFSNGNFALYIPHG